MSDERYTRWNEEALRDEDCGPFLGEAHLADITARGYAMPAETGPLCRLVASLRVELEEARRALERYQGTLIDRAHAAESRAAAAGYTAADVNDAILMTRRLSKEEAATSLASAIERAEGAERERTAAFQRGRNEAWLALQEHAARMGDDPRASGVALAAELLNEHLIPMNGGK